MNEAKSVPVDDKNFVGIGKIIFDSNAEWNIPVLHFMVDKTASGNYEATLLEFGLVSWAEKQNDAIQSLVKQTHSHILHVLQKSEFNQFIDSVNNNVMDEYWKHYRKIDFTLASIGKDLRHQMDTQASREMKAIISEERKNFIQKLIKDNNETIVNELNKLPSLSGFVFEEIKGAA